MSHAVVVYADVAANADEPIVRLAWQFPRNSPITQQGPQESTSMSSTPQSVLAAFLGAFARLDLEAMLTHVAEDATAFLPAEHTRARLDGRRAIAEGLAAVIAKVRATGANELPLVAEDVQVEHVGDAAIATFHLRRDHLSRRTIVLAHQHGDWRIAHIHASNAEIG
jgi:ketosteroid isomerase-like protein